MSHDLSPLGFRKTPFTRELQVRERQRAQPGTVPDLETDALGRRGQRVDQRVAGSA